MSSLSPDTLVDDPLYLRLKEHLVESTGLTYYADKDLDLARRVGRRLATTGLRDCASYFDLLRDPLRGPSERDALIAEITIGETYFYRHAEHFGALRDQVLPDLMARNRVTHSLRIWCPGCADGPEPYSLAILLKRELGQLLAGWDVSIVGTDINRHSLARAREGRFEDWALRAVSPEMQQRCFLKDGKMWAIAPEYKEWVSFQYHNLVEDSYPSLLNNLSAFDLIVCRNVMIYFGPEMMHRVVQRFHQCLVPGAWLLVGPSEPNMTCFTSFRAVNAPGVTLYQKPAEPEPPPPPYVFAEIKLPPPAPSFLPRSGGIPANPPIRREATLAAARAHADRGDWEEAARCCDELLQRENLNSRVHFYHGLVLEQMRKHAQAEQSLRRAVYLDRQSVLAHYYLGLILQSRSDPRQAVRSFQNTLNLLESRPDGDVFPDADGITAGELKKLARMNLEILTERT